ncbi:uncharacterized protein J7T54_004369 [Emericellopsis cladophorae]|uniref:Uncharacterized protein n=1 Tax=Emericellopsis cladophorae TaxID=2686198 RepID=A0A9P9Y4I3_9HYPO|nr:uncharacterized protein J7T54_004369 [Emericellopsis cladophorae]KAI6783342.1 hypothetical protein J7T54_004369 [Emericellopsis cladophorae]
MDHHRKKSLLSNDLVFQPESQQPYAQQPYDPTAHDNHTSFSQAAYPRSPFQTSPYAENHKFESTMYDQPQGYVQRQPAPSTPEPAPAPKPRKNWFAFMSSKWAAMFMAITAIQAVICLCCEAYVFATFQSSLRPLQERNPDRNAKNPEELSSQYKTIPTFLTLFIFGFLYELIIVWDALRKKNTIQVIGVCFANLALVVYTAIQVDQLDIALDVLVKYNSLEAGRSKPNIWADINGYLIAIPAIIAVVTCIMVFLTWKLYQEFAWDILKSIGADYRMKKRFASYQIYIALLKFDFFFFLGFIIQLVVIVTRTDDPEFALTIATIPITIIILLAAAYFTRIENKPGMVVTIILYFGALAYFLFKLIRIWTWVDYYLAVQKSLTAFSVITILLILLTIANAIVCMRNFDKGLKTHILGAAKSREDDPELNSVNLNDVKPQPSRMTIE